jgi:hypothetical protein
MGTETEIIDWPDGEMEITPGFYPGSPGSNPGWAIVDKCLITEGPPDWRREPVGSRSSILKMPCGFNSRSFRCGRIRCWFPETDCESVWRRFDSARPPLFTTLQVCSWESSQPPKLTPTTLSGGARFESSRLCCSSCCVMPTWLD